MTAVLEETKQWAAKTRQRIEDIDKAIPQIEQEMANLSEQKHSLQDERRRIAPLVKSLESVGGDNIGGRARNGGGQRTPSAKPKPMPGRQIPDASVIDVIGRAGKPMTTREVAKALGVDARSIRHLLPRLVSAGSLAGDRDSGWMMPTEG